MNNMYFSLLFFLAVLCSSCDISNPDTNSKPFPIVDIDGNGYDSVQIGNRFWLNSNIKVTHFRNLFLFHNSPLLCLLFTVIPAKESILFYKD